MPSSQFVLLAFIAAFIIIIILICLGVEWAWVRDQRDRRKTGEIVVKQKTVGDVVIDPIIENIQKNPSKWRLVQNRFETQIARGKLHLVKGRSDSGPVKVYLSGEDIVTSESKYLMETFNNAVKWFETREQEKETKNKERLVGKILRLLDKENK